MLRTYNRGGLLPKLRSLFTKKNANTLKVQTPIVTCRHFHNRRQDPFTQMEEFMKDMEKKFWGEVNQNFPRFPAFPRLGRFAPESDVEVASKFASNAWGPTNLSSSNTFKLAFNFPGAKADDIKVTLKDRLLTIEAKIEESSDTTKINQAFNYEYTLPKSVDVDALKSIFTADNLLTIEAPKTPEDSAKVINIHKE